MPGKNPRPRRSRAGRALLAAAGAATIAACGGTSVALQADGLDLPTTATPKPLASTTIYTSPDGGIYRNTVHLDVLMVTRRDVSSLAQRLGTAQRWAPLHPFGEFTLVAVRLRNDGKAWSEPSLNDLQIASDYAPAQAAQGPLHAFYHPTYPLAELSDTAPGSECTPHLDPGQSTTVVLVYPPIQIPGDGIVWGRYQDFALRVPQGGSVGALTGRSVHAAVCTPPQDTGAAGP